MRRYWKSVLGIKLILVVAAACCLFGCNGSSTTSKTSGTSGDATEAKALAAKEGAAAAAKNPACADAVYPDLDSIETGKYAPLRGHCSCTSTAKPWGVRKSHHFSSII